jgi:hypothetical protein
MAPPGAPCPQTRRTGTASATRGGTTMRRSFAATGPGHRFAPGSGALDGRIMGPRRADDKMSNGLQSRKRRLDPGRAPAVASGTVAGMVIA